MDARFIVVLSVNTKPGKLRGRPEFGTIPLAYYRKGLFMNQGSCTTGIICLAMGLSIIVARYNRVKWFNDQSQTRSFEKHFGKKWTDVIIYSYGLVIIGMGVLATIYQ
jgi:hypothetical protein